MRRIFWANILLIICLGIPQGVPAAGNQGPGLLTHLGQPVFLSGMNIAWIDFGNDLDLFNETKFTKALDDVSLAGGNCVRWWLHVNGSKSPLFSADGYVTGISPNTIPNLKKALDMAWDRGLVMILTLWSFDMLQNQGQDMIATKRLIEDKKATAYYIKNALIPMVKAVKGHPGLLAWEVCNEPEGMLSTSGWSAARTELNFIQQFVNLIAGAIHKEDPQAKVTNGSVNLALVGNVGGLINCYSDQRLIKAGGDKLGYLDFYQVHFYPDHNDELISPFHHPASYWKLDKPVLIGEFPAKGIRESGKGFQPKTSLTTEQAYQYALENGYAGALAWTWTNHDGFGGVADATPGFKKVLELAPDKINIGNVNRAPAIVETVKNLTVEMNSPSVTDYVNVTKLFFDFEDKTDLKYCVENSNQDLVKAELSDSGKLGFTFAPGLSGSTLITLAATDQGGKQARLTFSVFVPDPKTDNMALGKPVKASSIDNDEDKAEYINDGNPKTRWSSAYQNSEWIYVDLLKESKISKIRMTWEVAYGKGYRIEISTDGKEWRSVFEEKDGDGGADEIILPEPVTARYLRMFGTEKATQWGFSIWELEVYQEK
ncbi:MAG: discoidin domain-containing protein [Firmicutes bacterium]|nr:discoidin domain-containing protein [Bacillota bacterium]